MPEDFPYSFTYSKFGEGAWFSHLDTVRILERAVRRAGLDVVYTRGYNPHIRISTVRALPLGLASACEWFTLRLRHPEDPETLGRKLDDRLPAGFRIVRVQPGRPPPPEDAFRLDLRFRGDGGAAERAMDRLFSMERFEVERIKKGVSCRRDVRPFFRRGRRRSPGTLSFYAGPVEGERPSPGDLVRALRILAEEHGLEVEEIALIPSGFACAGDEDAEGRRRFSG